MVIPHQTRKWVTPLVLFGFKTQQQPWSPMHKTKNRKILNHHHSIGRTKTHMTTMSQGNKKITTRKILATNNKVLVCTDSLCFSQEILATSYKSFGLYRYPYARQFVIFYWIWTGNLLDSNLEVYLLDTLLVLDLETLGLQILITITIYISWDFDFKGTPNY